MNIQADIGPDDDNVGHAENIQPGVGPADVGQVDNIQPDVSPADVGPATNVRSRARKADPQKWKKNIRKRLRNSGLEFMNTRGMRVPKQVMGNVNCSHCKLSVHRK